MRLLSTKLPPINAEHLDIKQFPHQIASYIAYEALNLIAPRPNSAIKVVGDILQQIYSFSQAEFSRIETMFQVRHKFFWRLWVDFTWSKNVVAC